MHYQSQYDGVTENVRITKDENNNYILESGYSHRTMIDLSDIELEKRGFKSISQRSLKELIKQNKLIGIEVNGDIIPNCIQLNDIAKLYPNNTIIKALLNNGIYNDDENNLHIKIIHPLIPEKYLK